MGREGGWFVLPYMLPGAHLANVNISGLEVVPLQRAVGCGATAKPAGSKKTTVDSLQPGTWRVCVRPEFLA